ncbi:hypothetical protein IH779_01365 [Patescibacteria group bacterium]|nr:hypothetical protein [Patescibacteria group bacterium]
MLWVLFAVLAYLFLAVGVFIDRFLMKGPLKSPFAYAFYAGMLNSLVILFLLLNVFFDFLEPVSGITIILGMLTGFLAVWTLLVWFILVSKEEVSKASPVVGALQPILIVGVSLLFFLEQAIPSLNEISAFLLFLVGSVIIVKKPGGFPLLKNHTTLFILSAFYFSLSWMLLKVLFVLTNFWTVLVLVGIGSIIGAATLLFLPETRIDLAKKGLPIQKGLLIPFFIGRVAGAFGAIFQLAAIFFATIPQVPLIGALAGIQFLFLYFLLFFFAGKLPEMEEEMSGKALLKKIVGMVIIGLGFLTLTL